MVRFDDAVKAALDVLRSDFAGRSTEFHVTLVRDPAGLLTVVLPDGALPAGGWSGLARRLHDALGAYSPGSDGVLLAHADLIQPIDILESPDRVRLQPEADFGLGVVLVDRLLTNLDWTRQPLTVEPPVPVATFFSIKGGVGRTTALCALARHLAREGKRVLVVDLDLEAPGLGPALLGTELPSYGMIDWCVESLVDQADQALFEDILVPSRLSSGTPGTILVCPAAGARTQDYVSKMGRAYLPTLSADGTQTVGIANRLLAFLELAAARLEPVDVVLLDARAGLSDAGSAAVTQLGAEVLLFGRNDPQSWNSYRQLFRHLRLSRGVSFSMPESDLRYRLKMVAAQVDSNEEAIMGWIDQSYSTWQELYDSEEVPAPRDARAETFDRLDSSAPHFPLRVLFDSQFRAVDWQDPTKRPDDLSLDAAFGEFVRNVSARLFATPVVVDGDLT